MGGCTKMQSDEAHIIIKVIIMTSSRYRDGAPPPGFFWLFAIRELVSNKPCVNRDPRSILVGEW